MDMTLKSNQPAMVSVGRRSPVLGLGWIEGELERVRIHDAEFFARLEDSRLAIPGAADVAECIALADCSPSAAVRGYVLGLLSNNLSFS